MLDLASTVASVVPSSAQLTAAAAAKRPNSKKTGLDGLRLDDGISDNSVDARPAKKRAGDACCLQVFLQCYPLWSLLLLGCLAAASADVNSMCCTLCSVALYAVRQDGRALQRCLKPNATMRFRQDLRILFS